MNKNFKKFSNPVVPSQEEMLNLLNNDKSNNDKRLRNYNDNMDDTDLILDILVLYTNEALNDFSGRFVVKHLSYSCSILLITMFSKCK